MRAILLVAATLAFVVSPYASGSFGGFDPNAFPIPQDDPPVQPAGYAFAIWGVIYLWLVVHAVFGLVKRDADAAWDRVRWPMIASLALGAPWIAVAQTSPLAATALIWAMLVPALIAVARLDHGRDPWLLAAPIGLYAGWLTAASCVSVALVGAGWGIVLGERGWAWVGLALALVIGAAMIRRVRAPLTFALAAAWALVGVMVQNLGTVLPLAIGAAAGAVALLALWATRPAPRN
ncbi:hypothetical protein KTJ87_10915 [Rhodobacteraceae bacterium ASV31]|nr:hypothetical protein [Anianabacter salinae]